MTFGDCHFLQTMFFSVCLVSLFALCHLLNFAVCNFKKTPKGQRLTAYPFLCHFMLNDKKGDFFLTIPMLHCYAKRLLPYWQSKERPYLQSTATGAGF